LSLIISITATTAVWAKTAPVAAEQLASEQTAPLASAQTEQAAPLPSPQSNSPVRATVPWVRNVELEAIAEGLNPPGWQGSAVTTSAESDADKLAVLAEYGCQARISRSFQRGQRRIDATVYQFLTPQGAYGAYNYFRRGASNSIVKGDGSSEEDQSISVWKDRYFISVTGTSKDDDESKALISSLTDKLIAGVPGHSEIPATVAHLPMLDRVKGSERIIMGPLTARRLFPAPSLALLSFDTSSGAAVADYQTQEPYRERMKLLVVYYPNPSTAATAYYNYIKELQGEHPNLGSATESSLFKVGVGYLLCELRSNQVVIVSGAKKRQAASLLAHQL